MLFRRQFGVGPYVLDFYCPELRLAIELDGAVHDSAEAIAYDRERTDYLTGEFGIHVLRFRNELVFEMPERILIACLAPMPGTVCSCSKQKRSSSDWNPKSVMASSLCWSDASTLTDSLSSLSIAAILSEVFRETSRRYSTPPGVRMVI